MYKAIFICFLSSFCGFMLFSQDISFEQHVISDDFIEGYDVWPYDLNSDGYIDVLACGKGSGGQIAFWLSDGSGNFEKTVLKQGLSGARSVRADDMNKDLLPDIVCGAWLANDVVYFESQGDGSYLEHIVDDNFKGAHTIDLKDVNGDGSLDILCSGFDYYGHNGEIAWWENDGQDSISWTKHLISERFQQSPFIYGEDMDNDGDLDVIACGELNNEILWWENDGTGVFVGEHMVDSVFNSAHTVIARDLDLDNDMDILAAGCMQTKLAWYENDGSQNFIKHNLTPNGGDLWLDAADLDLDGDMDLVCAAMSCSYIRWYENDGSQEFTRYNVDGFFTSGFAVIPVNMDADGDIDLLAIGRTSNKISWFENNASSVISVNDYNGLQEVYISIYPNPCNDYLYVHVGQDELKQISIASSDGRKVRIFQTPDRDIPIWTGNFPDGMYILNVTLSDGKSGAIKFIKN